MAQRIIYFTKHIHYFSIDYFVYFLTNIDLDIISIKILTQTASIKIIIFIRTYYTYKDVIVTV